MLKTMLMSTIEYKLFNYDTISLIVATTQNTTGLQESVSSSFKIAYDTSSYRLKSSDFYHACHFTWWRHQMETFSALLVTSAGNSSTPGEFPAQRPVMRSFDVFFDLRLNKRLSKLSWGWWFETLSRPLWRHCNEIHRYVILCSEIWGQF